MTFRKIYCWLVVGMLLLPTMTTAQESSVPVSDAGLTIHVVQRDETLTRIAEAYGLTTSELATLNGVTNLGSIQVGQRLLVPTEVQNELPTVIHVVQPGESLNSIAQLYGVEAVALAVANGVTQENPLYVGQALIVTLSAAPIAVETPLQPPTETSLEVAAAAPETGRGVWHTIVPGETLFRIATQYGVTVAEVAQVNGISDPTLIFAGQQLLIPGVEAPQLAAELPAPITGLTVSPLILVEGQTGEFRLSASQPVEITGQFLDRPLTFLPSGSAQEYVSLVGVPLFTEPGIYPLFLNVTGGAEPLSLNVNIQVLGGLYGSEYINLLDDRTDLLDPNVEAAEMALLERVMASVTPTRYFDGPMGLPAAATMTSPFGTRRSYNGDGFNRFHAGADFAGVPGTPVLASAPGVVVMADTLNVRGNATIIDHGWGVYSGYWHQTEQYVSPGDVVATGQVIGTIGSTGRVTGAHLHWELWVNGVPVDPMQWVSQPF